MYVSDRCADVAIYFKRLILGSVIWFMKCEEFVHPLVTSEQVQLDSCMNCKCMTSYECEDALRSFLSVVTGMHFYEPYTWGILATSAR